MLPAVEARDLNPWTIREKSKALGLLGGLLFVFRWTGAVLCIAGCLAAFLALPYHSLSCNNQKCFQPLQSVPGWMSVFVVSESVLVCLYV